MRLDHLLSKEFLFWNGEKNCLEDSFKDIWPCLLAKRDGVFGLGMLSGFWSSAPDLTPPIRVIACLWLFVWCGCVGCELYSGREHLTVRFLRQSVSCFVRVSLLFVFLSVRWMPWHQGPMKDVVACDIPRGAGWRAVIRGFPNGGTRHELCRVTCI